ncbi:MAG: hypothetical protein ACREQ3_26365, partial [Candidatus Binatia bacterium]
FLGRWVEAIDCPMHLALSRVLNPSPTCPVLPRHCSVKMNNLFTALLRLCGERETVGPVGRAVKPNGERTPGVKGGKHHGSNP